MQANSRIYESQFLMNLERVETKGNKYKKLNILRTKRAF